MPTSSRYIAKQADMSGHITYSDDEHAVWQALIKEQKREIRGKACREYMEGFDRLQLSENRIPQCQEISKVLSKTTGWQVAPVDALIDANTFFQMLNDKIFPAAAFIRRRSEMKYLQEPDIFHEIFGHVPLLTHPDFANFTYTIGKLGHSSSPEYHVWLARLYWMTVEFGLIHSEQGLRVYGAGLVSSNSEIDYALNSNIPVRNSMNVLEALRTPYRIDIHQPVYFVIDSFDQLYEIANMDLLGLIDEARRLGLRPPTFLPQRQPPTTISNSIDNGAYNL